MSGTYGTTGEVYGNVKGVYGQLGVQLVNATETGTGTDTSTLKVTHARTDAGSGGTQTSTLKVKLPRTESGTCVDSSSPHNRITATQTSVVVDQVTVEMHIQEESGTAVDFSFLDIENDFTVTDSGTGVDSGAVSTTGGGTPVNASDTGHGTDSSTNRPHISVFDTATTTVQQVGGGLPEFGGIYYGEYAGAGAGGSISGEIATLKAALLRTELGLALDNSILLPHPPSPEPVPGLIVLSGKLRFRMGEGVLAYA